MLPLDAAKVAAQAEILRERLRMQLLGRRILAALIACIFVAAAVIEIHMAAYYMLFDRFGAKWTPLILAGGDVVLALVVLAVVGRAGPLERQATEAAALRDRALGEAGRALTLFATLTPVLRLLRGRGGLGAALAAAATTFLFRRR